MTLNLQFWKSPLRRFRHATLRAKIDLLQNETGAEIVETDQNGTTVTTIIDDEKPVKELVLAVRDELQNSIARANFTPTFNNYNQYTKIPDTDIYTIANESYGVIYNLPQEKLNATDEEVMYNGYSIAVNYLEKNGFSKSFRGLFFDVYENSNTGIYCSVNNETLPFILSCAKNTWYETEKKELILALAKAANTDLVSCKSSCVVKDSQISPYQTITANGGNAALLFYRTSPDADWQFFTGTQGVLDCTDYSTEDLKNAYAGDACWDNSTGQDSTVQP